MPKEAELNQVLLVGRFGGVETTENFMVHAPQKRYLVVECDRKEFLVEVSQALHRQTVENVEVGGTIGVKGHLDLRFYKLQIIADKVTPVRKEEQES